MRYLFWLLISLSLQAQEVIPGLIPLFYTIPAARDLVIPGEIAHQRALNGEDISLIDPDPTTNIWKPNDFKIKQKIEATHFKDVTWISDLPARQGQLRFTVKNNSNEEILVMLSKKVHHILLKKNILEKLGYILPGLAWGPSINIHFKDSLDKEFFKASMKDKLIGGSERWILKEEELLITIQDVLLIEPNNEIYNLALGLMPKDIPQGRRILRSAYVPLALVDSPESINLFSWQAGRLVLNHLKLNQSIDLDTSYGTSYEDARWIARKIAVLNRSDWEEIVQKAYFPKAVSALLIEKMISRRNDLLQLLKIEASPLDFDSLVSDGADLKEGEIQTEFFEGYVSRFSFGDPESPFSTDEIAFYALGRLQSQMFDTVLSQFNRVIGTNDEKRYQELIEELVSKGSGIVPTQTLFMPTLHGGVTVGRDIIAGSYMGTNQRVQLADTLAVNLDLGLVAGIEGMDLPLMARGNAHLFIERKYSHLKPVVSIKKSLQEPYKNLIIPFLLKNFGKNLDRINEANEENRDLILQSVVGELKEKMSIGESFIVTDSLIPSVGIELQTSLSAMMAYDKNLLKLQAQASAQKLVLKRFHFFRASENVFHLYQDQGNATKWNLSIKLKSYVPIMGVNFRGSKADGKVLYYPLNLHPKTVTAETLKALSIALKRTSHQSLIDLIKPFELNHEVSENHNTTQFLIFRRNRLRDNQEISISHPQGGDKKIIQRRYDSITTGRDIESFTLETLNDLMKLFTNVDLSLSAMPTMNPGFSLGGRAKNKIFVSELMENRYSTQVLSVFNGWKAKQRQLKKLIEKLNTELGEEAFPDSSYQNTQSLLLYQIQWQLMIAEEGMIRLLNYPEASWRSILKDHPAKQDPIHFEMLVNYFYSSAKKISSLMSIKDDSAMKKWHAWLKEVLDVVDLKMLVELAGPENASYTARMEGFRRGDENGDQALVSHVWGELPLELQTLPSFKYLNKTGMIEGEFYLNWLLERAL